MNESMMNKIDLLQRLQNWYLKECNEDWEHSFGVTIETLDNPGWMVKIDLMETPWEALTIPRKNIDRTEQDWVHTEIIEAKFIGTGGPKNLTEIISAFFAIIDEHPE